MPERGKTQSRKRTGAREPLARVCSLTCYRKARSEIRDNLRFARRVTKNDDTDDTAAALRVSVSSNCAAVLSRWDLCKLRDGVRDFRDVRFHHRRPQVVFSKFHVGNIRGACERHVPFLQTARGRGAIFRLDSRERSLLEEIFVSCNRTLSEEQIRASGWT